jgi:protein-disulfide isomerase
MRKLLLLFLLTAMKPVVAEPPPGGGCTIAGRDNAAVTVEEFGDFQCGYCANSAKTMHKIVENYPDQVRLVFRNLPLPSHGPESEQAAKAFLAVCQQSPQLADQFQNFVFTHQSELMDQGDGFLYSAANQVGANVEQMKTDMQSEKVASLLVADQKAAEKLNFNGTPSFLINSKKVVGARSYDVFQKKIEEELHN